MQPDQKNKDPFLDFIGDAIPLKKSKKITKKHDLADIKKYGIIKKSKTKKRIPEEKKQKETKQLTRSIEKRSLLTRRLKKGGILIDKKIDFHGLSLQEAKSKFIITIDECFYLKKRCLLFITGKGAIKKTDHEKQTRLYYGKIRENFKMWVNEKSIATKILSVVPADPAHGGDGAFFVYLRKKTKF